MRVLAALAAISLLLSACIPESEARTSASNDPAGFIPGLYTPPTDVEEEPDDDPADDPRTDLPDEVIFLEPSLVINPVPNTQLTRIADVTCTWDGMLVFADRDSGEIFYQRPDAKGETRSLTQLDVLAGEGLGIRALATSTLLNNPTDIYALVAVDKPARQQVVRIQHEMGENVQISVIVDDLPLAETNNGGGLCVLYDTSVLVGMGDGGDPQAALADDSLAGRILRYCPDGTLPLDNPDPNSPEYCRGVCNPVAIQEVIAGVPYVTERRAAGDCILRADNAADFCWPQASSAAGFSEGTVVGARPGAGSITDLSRADLADGTVLFISDLDSGEVSRVEINGDLTGVSSDEMSLCMDLETLGNRPIALLTGEGGSLLVATQSQLWVVTRAESE